MPRKPKIKEYETGDSVNIRLVYPSGSDEYMVAAETVRFSVSGYTEHPTTFPIQMYDYPAMSEDLKEVISIGYRTENKVDDLRREQNKIRVLVEKVAEKLEVSVDGTDNEEAVLDVTDDEAQEMILEFLGNVGITYPSDIAIDLNLDIDQVTRILRKLEEEGVIEPHER